MRQIHDVLGGATGLDDDELMKEFEEMEAAQLDEELLAPAPVPTAQVPHAPMPSVPTGMVAPKRKTQEELELEALEAEMAA
eukprot:gene3759-13819_t